MLIAGPNSVRRVWVYEQTAWYRLRAPLAHVPTACARCVRKVCFMNKRGLTPGDSSPSLTKCGTYNKVTACHHQEKRIQKDFLLRPFAGAACQLSSFHNRNSFRCGCQAVCYKGLACVLSLSQLLLSKADMDTSPEWSKGVDSSSTSASCVGSNPTGVIVQILWQ